MTLQEKLNTMRERAKSRVPPETRAIMQRSIDDLRTGGIMTRVARVGQPAPDFALPNRFVIDRQGLIRAVDADPDHTRRPEPARTVETLAGLRGTDRPS